MLDSALEENQNPVVSHGNGDPTFLGLLEEMVAFHKHKSGGYGTGADPFANFTAVAHISAEARYFYPMLRMIEKLTRAMSLYDQQRYEELGEEFIDIAGLALCAEAMRRDDLLRAKIHLPEQ